MPVTTAALNDTVGRSVAITGLTGIAVIHVLQAPEAFDETFYLGLLFVGAVVISVALAAALTLGSDTGVWTATAVLPALILLGYVLSRTSGLPDATDDVGEWDEPLGLVSMVVEGLLVCVAGGVLGARRQDAGVVVAGVAVTRESPMPAMTRDGITAR
jgi:FtsH-binding integral membrane protein